MELRDRLGFRSSPLTVGLWAGPTTSLSLSCPVGEHCPLPAISRIRGMKVLRYTGMAHRVSAEWASDPIRPFRSPWMYMGDVLLLGVSLTLPCLPPDPRRAWRAC